MPKFYVSCGDIRTIVDCDNAKDAASLSVQRVQGGELLEPFFYVDERGFRDYETLINGATDKRAIIDSNELAEHIFLYGEICVDSD